MIQPLFNGMLAILLAKFCLNDLPHAAGLTEPDHERPPTIAQLRYIAGLRQRLKMTITYERQVVTFGEAGRMIRELEAEERDRERLEKLKGGNPGTEVITFSDVNVGDVVDVYTSLYRRPRQLEWTVKAKPMGRGYEGLILESKGAGDLYLPQKSITKIVRHSVGNPNTATGACYPDAWRFLIKQEEGELVHGEVTGADGMTRKHAWIELPTGFIYEPQTARFYEHDVFKRAFNPVGAARYTAEEAAIMVARTGNHGPWTDEERAEWLSRTNPGNPYPPRIGVIPKLPEEAHGDILFYEYIRDLCKYEALSEEDAQRLWEGYRRQHYGR